MMPPMIAISMLNMYGTKRDENFSWEKVSLWNQMINAGEYEINRANLLFPRQENEDYDFIWVVLWPSVEARNTG